MPRELERSTFFIEGTGDFEGSMLRLEVVQPKSPVKQESELVSKEVLTPDGSFFDQDLTFENILLKLKEALAKEGMDSLPDNLKGTEVSISWKVK